MKEKLLKKYNMKPDDPYPPVYEDDKYWGIELGIEDMSYRVMMIPKCKMTIYGGSKEDHLEVIENSEKYIVKVITSKLSIHEEIEKAIQNWIRNYEKNNECQNLKGKD